MKHENRIYDILRRFTDGIIHSSYRRDILKWLLNDNESDEKDKALFRLWNEVDTSALSSSQIQSSLRSVKLKLGLNTFGVEEKKIFHLNLILKYAAIFLLPLISGLSVWFLMNNSYKNTSNMIECFVPNGEKKTITLSDGTKVILNSGSLFIYPEQFYGDERCVYLSGEGYFDVFRCDDFPFIVHTGRLNVKVLGTRFNIEAYPDEKSITTTLNKGSVKVFIPEKESDGLILKPNEQAVYHSNNMSLDLKKVDANDYSSWTEGEICFIQEPLFSVLKTLSRRYNVEFRYDDKINIEDLYTVNFKSDETIEQVVQVLTSIIDKDIVASIKGDIVYLRTREKGGNR